MKIKPIVRNINHQIKQTPQRYYCAGKNGYCKGKSVAQENKHNSVHKMYDISVGVSKEVFKSASIDDLPPIAGLLGLCTPIPFASVAMYALGKVVQVAVNLSRGKIKF